MRLRIEVASAAVRSGRALQVRGMFDLPADAGLVQTWQVDLPLEERGWNVGLIVGPSGCGKSTVARELFRESLQAVVSRVEAWTRDGCVLDAFPEEMSIRDIVGLLSAVGFSSPPAWLRPFGVLSTGQQFRVTLALLLAYAEPGVPVVFDEYSSVVDRTVARIGSCALAKTVRRRGQCFVAVTCHEDVEDWLQPDWVYRPAENAFQWRCLRRRPEIALDIVRCQASAWRLFAPHHYLNAKLHPSATCLLASWQDQPVAFSAWLPHLGSGPCARREHRTVTLPDYQGVGIGNALSDFAASLWLALGYRALSTTTHPAMIRARLASRNWRMHRGPALATRRSGRVRHATTRLTAGFHYVGPAAPRSLARALFL